MRYERAELDGVVVVHPERHEDERGHFVRTFCTEEFSREGLVAAFPQSSLSFNRRAGTVRGLHHQLPPHGETKLVRCARGAILDVVVDIRPGSPTYRQWRGFRLTAANGLSLYIPDGFAHGFQTLEDDTEVSYSITPPYAPGTAAGLRWDDPAIAVQWPLPISTIAEKDRTWPYLGA